MKIQHLFKGSVLITILLSHNLIFAQNTDTSTQTGWRTQNANIEAEEAHTARTNAETDALNANTAAQNANTATQNANTRTQNQNTTARMVTRIPAPKEATVIPPGFDECTVVKEGWVNGIWVPEHRVCKYSKSKEGVAWIEAHWACTEYKTTENLTGECMKWDWKPGHWLKTLDTH